MAGESAWASLPGLGRIAGKRKQSVRVRGADRRIHKSDLDAFIEDLGDSGPIVRALVTAVEERIRTVRSLSSLSSPLAIEYLERLARPIPTLTPEAGVEIVTRAYLAHMEVETAPSAYGCDTVAELEGLPGLRRGSPPQGLSTRIVKASRRQFERIRALPAPVWDGLVMDLMWRAHRSSPDDSGDLLAIAVVEGLARFGWVLRLMDVRYGLGPELS